MQVLTNIRLSRNQIKYIAVFAMLLNHIAYVFMDEGSLLAKVFTNIGYFTAITMCYFLVEGYFYTHSKKAYARRLLIFAFISQLPFCLALTKNAVISFTGFNMMFSLFLCFMLIYCYINVKDPLNRSICSTVIIILSLFCDWFFMAPIFTKLFLLSRGGHINKMQAFKYSAFIFGIFNFIFNTAQMPFYERILSALANMAAPLLAGIVITYFYDDKKPSKASKFSKWFFYIFYPAHLMILGMLRLYIILYPQTVCITIL
ncbi:MAG: TraX family protein [Eubacteriales bacterium]|nr:TraX family protein [Eubacteriales bacterium]